MILWILVVVGAAGCIVSGVSFLFDTFYGAQFKKAMGSVPGVVQRSAQGWLRLLLPSLALLVAGLLLMSVCSRRKPAPSADDGFGMTTREYPGESQGTLPTPSRPSDPPV